MHTCDVSLESAFSVCQRLSVDDVQPPSSLRPTGGAGCWFFGRPPSEVSGLIARGKLVWDCVMIEGSWKTLTIFT